MRAREFTINVPITIKINGDDDPEINMPGTDEPKSVDELDPDPVMVPPLQQKMELLKRAVDIDNVFDGTSIDKTTNGQDDYKQELVSITKNAGIPNAAAIMALTDEEPLDD